MRVTNKISSAFCNTCSCFHLEPSGVLQTFAGFISVHGFLFPVAGSLPWMAGQVLLQFHRMRKPVTETCEVKRKRAVRNIRSMLQVFSSLHSVEAKGAACQKIADKWYRDNGLPEQIPGLVLGEELTVTPPANLLLHADLMQYSPRDLLLFLVNEIVSGAQSTSACCNNLSWQFLLGCVDARHPAVNN